MPDPLPEHGHSQAEVERRIGAPQGRGYLRDIVYGAIDGSVTTFAIVAGVAGAGLSPLVIVALGLANVLADGFSMAAGNYSGTKAELDDIRRLRQVEERHIRLDPDGERREVRQILRMKGLSGQALEDATDQICANTETWVQTMLEGEYGLSAVDPHPMRAALATFGAFLVAGMIPLLPFILSVPDALRWSTLMTGVTFFAIGAYKSHWSLAPWWRSGLESLAIGGVAAGLAYGVGTLFQ
ncbi:VIT1/CCC1 transporter family protein [Mesobacterium sp. TK19101]|uniref:VIT1/CCC1 transporter family protein n=1 Tax=Mesobacterium hydrothermale TaxID=3111907 RepID=A0ABU6HIP6_9RHOB|nr:VIT1/CCC1 transporter family protein [Mesobacterium sp. TK19101]MEC3861987.1 VIT1/CCC1 transporter family protein [Mesobacterium sp. TK19101]